MTFLQNIGQIYRNNNVLYSLLLLFVFMHEPRAQSINDLTYNFSVFTKESVTLKPNEIEGNVATGGNATITGHVQIKPLGSGYFKYNNVEIGLATRGRVDVYAGQELKLDGGFYIKIGDKGNMSANYQTSVIDILGASSGGKIKINSRPGTPPVNDNNNPPFENIFGNGPGQIDIDGSFAQLEALSAYYGTLTNNVTAKNQDGPQTLSGPFLTPLPFSKPLFQLVSNAVNVLTIDAGVWSNFNEIKFSGFSTDPGFALIINFVNVNNNSLVKFVNNGIEDKIPQIQRTLLNFPDVTGNISLQGMVRGTVLAPKANIYKKPNQNLVGAVIAKSYVHDGDELHFYPFMPTIPGVPKQIFADAITECILDAPYLIYDVTGNFDLTGKTVKIEWLAPDGTVVHVDNSKPLQGSLLFPGAAVDVNGNGVAWPGWEYINGNWVEVDDAFAQLRKPGAKVRFTVNPEMEVTIAYPPSSPDCKTDPPGDTPPVLPVNLSSFFVEEGENQSVSLRWVASDAVDFSHFEIERSSDGLEFKQVGKVAFKENTSYYHYNDSPGQASVLYYRLKLVDLDGSYVYSKVEALALKNSIQSYSFPNPFGSKLQFYSPVRQGASVYDMTGRLITTLKLDEGNNEINAQSWATGLYLIRTDSRETVKVLKQ